MTILGIEAAAKVAGAALYKDGQIIAEQMVNGTLTHSQTLMPMIDSVLKAADIQPEELSAIALTCGPGSFTGLRIGAATAKGMALGLKIPVIPVSTLEALSYNIGPTDCLIVPMMDARRSQVYAAAYYYEGESLKQRLEPRAIPPQQLAEDLKEIKKPVILVGDGASLYAEKMEILLEEAVYLAPPHLCHARAGSVVSLGAIKYERAEYISGSELKLEYLRKPQAEREREERESRR